MGEVQDWLKGVLERGVIGRRASSSGLAQSSISSSVSTPSSAPLLSSMHAAMGSKRFVRDFVAAWAKVMNLDRFDLK